MSFSTSRRSECIFARRLLPSLCLLVATWLLCSPVAAENRTSAETFLQRQRGLTRIKNSNVWALADEIQLRRRLGQLDRLKQTVQTTEKYLQRRIDENGRLWKRRVQVEAAVRQAARFPSDDPQRRLLKVQVNALRKQAYQPDRLGGAPDVQSRLIDLTRSRNTLLLSVAWIRRTEPKLQTSYARLKDDRQVAAALAQLGSGNRLGPVKKYTSDMKRLAQYESLAGAAHVPLYRQSGRLRIGAILNRQTPITFTWRTSSGPTLLTATALESAGFQVPRDAQRATLTVGKGRRLAVRRITIPYLQLGKHSLRNVPALALPPEGEDLGATIGRDAFVDFQITVQPQQFRLVIEPVE